MHAAATALVLCAAVATALGSGADIPAVWIRPGLAMPMVGAGSCCGDYNISSWLAAGGRHIDTSCDYGSQGNIAKAIAASGIPRNELFITSKLDPESYGPDVSSALQSQVLTPLNTDYVDLILMHHAGRHQKDHNTHPPCFNATDPRGTYYQCRIDTWRSFQTLRKQGKVKAIGVSNFEQLQLDQLYDTTQEYPAVNQIEFHPTWHTFDLMDYCHGHNISVTAYAPTGNYPARSKDLDAPEVKALAKKYGVSVGQVTLRWELQRMQGTGVVIPRSHSPSNQADNLDIFKFEISTADLATLDNLPQKKVYDTQCQPWC